MVEEANSFVQLIHTMRVGRIEHRDNIKLEIIGKIQVTDG